MRFACDVAAGVLVSPLVSVSPARPSPMAADFPSSRFNSPEQLIVEVFSELDQQTVQQHWQAVNVILRLSMLAGLQMHLDATLHLLCDFAAEMAPSDACLAYFWDESQEQVQLRVVRGMEGVAEDAVTRGNILNFWATKYSRPLLVPRGANLQADALLEKVRASAALVVPLFVSNRVIGSMQLFSAPGLLQPRRRAIAVDPLPGGRKPAQPRVRQ